VSHPHGYYEDKPLFQGDRCPACRDGIITMHGTELCCISCGITLENHPIPILALNQYEAVNMFSLQPEGTVGTPAMDLSVTDDGRIAGAVWLERNTRNK